MSYGLVHRQTEIGGGMANALVEPTARQVARQTQRVKTFGSFF